MANENQCKATPYETLKSWAEKVGLRPRTLYNTSVTGEVEAGFELASGIAPDSDECCDKMQRRVFVLAYPAFRHGVYVQLETQHYDATEDLRRDYGLPATPEVSVGDKDYTYTHGEYGFVKSRLEEAHTGISAFLDEETEFGSPVGARTHRRLDLFVTLSRLVDGDELARLREFGDEENSGK